MNKLRNFFLFLFALAFTLSAHAQVPEYTGTVFDKLQETLDDGSLFFGVVVGLAVLVTGFFLGRKWLKSV